MKRRTRALLHVRIPGDLADQIREQTALVRCRFPKASQNDVVCSLLRESLASMKEHGPHEREDGASP